MPITTPRHPARTETPPVAAPLAAPRPSVTLDGLHAALEWLAAAALVALLAVLLSGCGEVPLYECDPASKPLPSNVRGVCRTTSERRADIQARQEPTPEWDTWAE